MTSVRTTGLKSCRGLEVDYCKLREDSMNVYIVTEGWSPGSRRTKGLVMLTKAELTDIGAEAVRDLGLQRWRVWNADTEPETLVNRRPDVHTAYNSRFNLTDGATFLTIRFRVEDSSGASSLTQSIKEALTTRFNELARRRTTHLTSPPG
jgi:hypothetical protein